jgi:nucleotide-binding universal stress UspA family protein
VPARFSTSEYAHALHDDAAGKLTAVADELDGAATVVCDGSPAGALHELAEAQDAAAVVVGATHRGTIGRVLIGDVGAGLLHGSPCPVAIAPRGYDAQTGAFHRIGVAFDGSPESEVALQAAVGIGRLTAGFVHSFTVLEPLDFSPGFSGTGLMPRREVEEARHESAQTIAEQALEAIPEGVQGASEVLHGSVPEALTEISAEMDLLVCGSRGYGAFRRVMAGSVARALAHQAECPLIVIPGEPARGADALWAGADVVQAR